MSDSLQGIRADTLRLLAQQKDLLTRIETTPDLLRDGRADGLARTLDLATAQDWRDLLDNELAKIDRLEMVLAVVGTMKAGKSTTINAIVGTEVLPNRNQPMTTLPTLIRHKAGQTTPVLLFARSEPVAAMADVVRSKIAALQAIGQLDRLALYREPDGRTLITGLAALNQAVRFKERYEGQEAIFGFLKGLNDLMRLARDPAIDIEPPFDDYDGIDELPVIEVEFFHLRHLPALQHGSLSLLDTPGPNESGQSTRLRKILRAQLARASAVLAVLDYTQLKSEAEAEVRNDLVEVLDQAEDRLFVLVNKFDQNDRNSLGVEEIRDHVALGLLNGRIDRERVFPASARNGYLANRALQELERAGRMPDAAAHEWVADFAKLALGVAWQRDLYISARARAAARDLWESSLFDDPIRQVVVRAAGQAAVFSLRAALARMVEHNRRIELFIELRRGALNQDVEAVRALIAGLEIDSAGIDAAQGEARRIAFRVAGVYGTLITRLQLDLRETLRASLSLYFKTGTLDSQSLDREMRRQFAASRPDYQRMCGTGYRFFQHLIEAEDGGDEGGDGTLLTPADKPIASFDPTTPILVFNSEAEARRLAGRIGGHIQILVQEAAHRLEGKLDEAATALEAGIASALDEAVGTIMAKAQGRLHHHGFRLQIEIPTPELTGIAVEFGDIGSAGLSQRTSARTVATRRAVPTESGVLGLLRRWWRRADDGWEHEVRPHLETHYQLDLDKIRAQAVQRLDGWSAETGATAHDAVAAALEPRLVDYFKELKGYLDSFRGVLNDGIEDHRRRQRSLDAIRQAIAAIAEGTLHHARETQALRTAIDALPIPVQEEVAVPPPTLPVPEADEDERTVVGGFAGADATVMGAAATLRARLSLELTYGDRTLRLETWDDRLTIGRGPDSTVVVTGKRASRHHAEIIYQNGAFVFTDASSNGCIIVQDGGERHMLNRSAQPLRGTGSIGLGLEPGKDAEHTLNFRIVLGT